MVKAERNAAAHQKQINVLRKWGRVEVDEIVFTIQGGLVRLFFSFFGPLPLRLRYLVGRESRFEIWRSPSPNGGMVDRIAVLDRPEAGFTPGWRFDRVWVAGKKYLVDRNQRDYLARLLMTAATPSTLGMQGRCADWYRDPWSFPDPFIQLRYWDGAAWTDHVHPPANRYD